MPPLQEMDESDAVDFLDNLMTLNSETEPEVRVNREINEKMTTGVSAYSDGYNACTTPPLQELTSSDVEDFFNDLPKSSVAEPKFQMNRKINENITAVVSSPIFEHSSSNIYNGDQAFDPAAHDHMAFDPAAQDHMTFDPAAQDHMAFDTAAQDHMAFDTTAQYHISQLSRNVPGPGLQSDSEYACNGE